MCSLVVSGACEREQVVWKKRDKSLLKKQETLFFKAKCIFLSYKLVFYNNNSSNFWKLCEFS
jgi:hypothetical protein